jgi:hypothetical protein
MYQAAPLPKIFCKNFSVGRLTSKVISAARPDGRGSLFPRPWGPPASHRLVVLLFRPRTQTLVTKLPLQRQNPL